MVESEIRDFLKTNGWETYYHKDNWIKTEWYNMPNIRIEYAGVSTQSAYEATIKSFEPKKEIKESTTYSNLTEDFNF